MWSTDLFCFQCMYINSKKKMDDVWSFLTDKNHCALARPNLLISVTGGAQAFAAMQHRLKELIKTDIVSAATKTGMAGGKRRALLPLHIYAYGHELEMVLDSCEINFIFTLSS